MATYFEALGLAADGAGVTFAACKKAFRDLSREMHPDTTSDETVIAEFKLISAAYQALSGDEKIATYRDAIVWGFLAGSGAKAWSRQWSELKGIADTGPKVVKAQERVRSQAGFTADDIADFVRQTERMRREARWGSANADDMRERAERDAQERREQQQRKAEREAHESNRREYGPSGKCGHPTKSGPCCRPAGHTPNGHMSQKVADQKRENQKRRQAGL